MCFCVWYGNRRKLRKGKDKNNAISVCVANNYGFALTVFIIFALGFVLCEFHNGSELDCLSDYSTFCWIFSNCLNCVL
jgi:hypothetical protein